ncbi:ABC transporter permease [Rhodoligotrophos defluvii]|uniref:ABC transporter permease n=1 Tax=Rhodoligotrophos defluvii TaxID=2561934 RepID=UPI0010C93F80|nr:ABC transporter permease [Rhodoligotrophos defluvii]
MKLRQSAADPETPGRARPSGFALFWATPLGLWQLVFFLGPLLFLIALSFWSVRNYRLMPDMTLANWTRIFNTGYFWDGYLRSLWYSAVAAAVASILAFPLAYTLAFKISDRARLFGAGLLITPFFTSYLVRAYTWRTMLGAGGIVNDVLGFVGLGPYAMINAYFGTLVGYLTLVLPLVALLQLLSLAFIDRRLIEAAHNLGCGRLRTVFSVVIPSARVGLILGAAFAFVLCFGDFVSPQILGGSNPPTVSLLIIDQVRAGSHWPRASVIALVMIVSLVVVVSAAMAFAYRRPGR